MGAENKMKTYEELEPGDYLLFDGKPAMRGTALRGYCVISEGSMYFDVDPKRIVLTTHLTIAQLRDAPKGSTIATHGLWGMVVEWKKTQIGRGQRWVSDGGYDVLTSEDVAPKGAYFLVKKDLVESGVALIPENVVKTGKGNYRGTVTLGNGVQGKFLIVVE